MFRARRPEADHEGFCHFGALGKPSATTEQNVSGKGVLERQLGDLFRGSTASDFVKCC